MNIGDTSRVGKHERAPRVLAYCHDGVGLGHLRRTLNICYDIGSIHPEVSFLIITGSPYTSLFTHGPRVDVLKLPALAKINNESYRAMYLALSDQQVQRFRERLLLDTTQHFSPDVFLVDKAPVGVRGELKPTLRWIREQGPSVRVIFGMRDIEDDSATTIRQWSTLGAFRTFEESYDEVWVYGMRSVFDVAREYELSPRIQEKVAFMGYLARRPCNHRISASDGVPEVLVTVGGGTDGAVVLETYLAEAARHMAAIGVRSTIVAGPDLPEADAHRLRAIAARIPSTEWLDFEPCMMCRIRQASLVVSMGGYNTLCEIALNRKPALVIPRTKPRLEQAIRAELWARRGVIEEVDPSSLTPRGLAGRVSAMLESKVTVTAPNLDLNGLDRVRDRFRAFWNEEALHAAAVPM